LGHKNKFYLFIILIILKIGIFALKQFGLFYFLSYNTFMIKLMIVNYFI